MLGSKSRLGNSQDVSSDALEDTPALESVPPKNKVDFADAFTSPEKLWARLVAYADRGSLETCAANQPRQHGALLDRLPPRP